MGAEKRKSWEHVKENQRSRGQRRKMIMEAGKRNGRDEWGTENGRQERQGDKKDGD